MEKDLTSIEVLGMALRSEEDASKFYGRIAKMIRNDLVRAKYESLAKEEVNHGIMILNLYKQMMGSDDKLPRVPGEPQTAERGTAEGNASDSLEDLLKLAIGREKKAKEFYLEASEKAIDPSGRKVLYYLSQVEEGHEEMLKKELEAYLKNKGWYLGEDDEDMIHLGP